MENLCLIHICLLKTKKIAGSDQSLPLLNVDGDIKSYGNIINREVFRDLQGNADTATKADRIKIGVSGWSGTGPTTYKSGFSEHDENGYSTPSKP